MEECYYTESNTLLHECSLRFLNYTSDTKSRNVPHIFLQNLLVITCSKFQVIFVTRLPDGIYWNKVNNRKRKMLEISSKLKSLVTIRM